ncbi:MAG: citrate (Si)-synthase, partial [Gammaproteobacteria bacterium]
MADESSPKTAGAVSLSEEARERPVQLPLYRGSLGPNVIDIRKLYQETGYFTFDPGFTSTASCESK